MNETINQPWINKWMSCPRWFAVSKSSNVASPFTLELSTHKYFPWQQSPLSLQVNYVTLPVGHGRPTHLRRPSPKGDPQELKWDPSSHLRCHRRRLSLPRGGRGEESGSSRAGGCGARSRFRLSQLKVQLGHLSAVRSWSSVSIFLCSLI